MSKWSRSKLCCRFFASVKIALLWSLFALLVSLKPFLSRLIQLETSIGVTDGGTIRVLFEQWLPSLSPPCLLLRSRNCEHSSVFDLIWCYLGFQHYLPYLKSPFINLRLILYWQDFDETNKYLPTYQKWMFYKKIIYFRFAVTVFLAGLVRKFKRLVCLHFCKQFYNSAFYKCYFEWLYG